MSVKLVGAEDLGKISVFPLVPNDQTALKEELDVAEGDRKKEIEQLLKKDAKETDKKEPNPVVLSDIWKDTGALIMLVRRPG